MGAGDGIDRREDDPVTFRLHFDRSLQHDDCLISMI